MLSEFFVLKKSIVFDNLGKRLSNKWHLENRDRTFESDPERIPIIMPTEWCEDAVALRRYFGRMERKNKMALAEQSRPPKLGTINSFHPKTSQNISSFSQPIINCDEQERFQTVEIPKYSDPTSMGSMSFEKN